MSNSTIDTRTAVFLLDDNGVLRITSKGMSQETLADAQENLDAVHRLVKDRRLPILADIRGARFTDAKWRGFYSREENKKLATAVAMLVASPISRVIGSLFVGFNKLPVPIKIFTSESEALDWLKNFLE